MSTLTVTIVGCGIIGYNHARAIAAHGDLEIVGLVDAAAAAADALADYVERELGLPRPAVAGSLAEAGPSDLVVICTPSGMHGALAEEALDAGSNVVIEKPLDTDLPRARRLAEVARRGEARGLVVSVISQHRFDPPSVVVAEAIRSGGFGRVTSAVASVPWWRSQAYYDSADWRGTWRLDGGGAAMNQGVHTVDLLVWFLGWPVEIGAQTARLAHERIEVEDVAVATIRFESGALAVLHATTAAFPDAAVRVHVYGTRGSALIDGDDLAFLHSAEDPATPNQASAVLDPGPSDAPGSPDGFTAGHLRQYRDIVAAIRAGSAPGVGVDDALVSLAVVKSIYVAATLGRTVRFEDVLAGRYDDLVPVTGGTP